MAYDDTKRLDHGDSFPSLTLESANGDPIQVPEAAKDGWLVLLIYRGLW